ncbi:hypothetical protein [Bilophila sp.]|uniref:hypothetical protein n=1 Tax=Bilophila sp. TaxID=1929485 RepID=UPI003076C994
MTGGCPALMRGLCRVSERYTLRGVPPFGMSWPLPPVWVRQPASENGGKMLLPLPRFRGGRPSRMPSLLMVRNLCRLSGGTLRLLIQRSA